MSDVEIYKAKRDDIASLQSIIARLGYKKDAGYFEGLLDESEQGKRDVLIAQKEKMAAGYVTLKWDEPPEIVDLNVVSEFRRAGIGRALIHACESEAKKKGFGQISLSVGLYPGYGSAQRLYVREGYIPDGHGVYYGGKIVEPMQTVAVDDDLTLRLLKAI